MPGDHMLTLAHTHPTPGPQEPSSTGQPQPQQCTCTHWGTRSFLTPAEPQAHRKEPGLVVMVMC